MEALTFLEFPFQIEPIQGRRKSHSQELLLEIVWCTMKNSRKSESPKPPTTQYLVHRKKTNLETLAQIF